MREYSKVSPLFWTGNTGRRLRGKAEIQLVALYMVTCPSSNMLGLYYLPPALAALEIGISLKKFMESVAFLEEIDFLEFDAHYETFFIVEMARFQIAENLSPKDKRVTWLASELRKCSSPKLARRFFDRYTTAYHLTDAPPPAPSKRKKVPSGMRWRVFERDGHRCVYCGKSGKDARLEVDHVVPESKGGETIDDNIVTACMDCNNGKSSRDPIPPPSYAPSYAPPPAPSKPGDRTGDGDRAEKRGGEAAAPQLSLVVEEPVLSFGEFGLARMTQTQHGKLKAKMGHHLDGFIRRFDHWVHEAPEAKANGVKRKERHAYESIGAWFDRDLKDGKLKLAATQTGHMEPAI